MRYPPLYAKGNTPLVNATYTNRTLAQRIWEAWRAVGRPIDVRVDEATGEIVSSTLNGVPI